MKKIDIMDIKSAIKSGDIIVEVQKNKILTPNEDGYITDKYIQVYLANTIGEKILIYSDLNITKEGDRYYAKLD